jgi:WD40 repeat protein
MGGARPGVTVVLLCFLAGCGDVGDDGGRSQSTGRPQGGQGKVIAPLPEWAATPDPLAVPGELPNPGVFPYQLPFQASPTFPCTSTRFVVVSSRIPGKRNRAELDVIDLQSGAKVCRVPEVEMSRLDRVVLSDDGEILAIGGRSRETSIRIWSTATGEMIEERPLTEDYGIVHLGSPSWFEILPGGELVAKRSAAEAVIYAWRPGQSDEPRGFKLFRHRRDSILRLDAVAVSPGGKYFAALMGNVLVAHDLATGQCVGAVEFPEAVFPLNYHCDSLHFSSDGRELAAVSVPQGQSNEEGNILCWDWTTGHLTSQITISAETVAASRSSSLASAFPRPWLQWLPDRAGWVVFGRAKCPQRSTGTFATLPVDADCPTRVIDESRFIVCRDDHQARKTELLFEGGPVDGERTGPVMETSRGADLAWTSAVDPSAAMTMYPRATAFPLLIPNDVTLHYSSLPDNRVTLIGEVEAENGTQSQLRFVDLSSGELVGQRKCDLLPAGRFAFSNDGRQAYIHRGASSFSVMNTVGEAWGGTALSGAQSHAGPSQWMGIVAEKAGLNLQVGSAQAELHLIWLPGHQGPSSFSLANVALGSLPIEGAFGLSHGGRYFAAIVGRKLVVHDIESGECVGTARLPDGLVLDSCRCAGLFFSPDGKEIVALLSSQSDQPDRLLGWDAESGELSQDWFVAREAWEQEHDGVDLLAYEGRAVEWLPDGSGWLLYGHMVLAREAPAETLGFPPSGDMSPRRLVNANTLVVRTSLTEDVAALTLLDRGRGELMPVTKENATPVADARWPDESHARPWEVELDGVEFVASAARREVVIPNGMSHQLRFSSTPSRYAAIGTAHQAISEIKKVLVMDTATGSVTDTIDLPERTEHRVMDVSPDGRYVLTCRSQLLEHLVQVWDAKAAQVVFQFNLESHLGDSSALRLLPGDRLLVAINTPPQIRVCNFRTSEVLVDFHLGQDHRFLQMGGTVSPGGRTFAVMADNTLFIYDLLEGICVAESPIRGPSQRNYPVVQSAFQLDGTRLYAIVRTRDEQGRLLVWDMASGQIVRDKMLDSATTALALEHRVDWQQPGWVPNEAPYLFVGNCVIDGATGRSIPLGFESGQRAVQVVGRGQVLMSQQGELGMNRGLVSTQCVIAPVQLSAGAGAQLVASVKPDPGQLHEPPPDLAEAAKRWHLEVDPAAPGAWEPSARLRIPIRPAVSAEIGNLPSPFVCLFDPQSEQVALHDMRTGRPHGNVSAVPRTFDVAAIRPDGRFIVLIGPTEARVIDTESGQAASIEPGRESVLFGSFSSDGSVVIVSEWGGRSSLLRCDPATGTVVARTPLRERDLTRNVVESLVSKVMSPGGRYLAFQALDSLYVYEANTGELVAEATLPHPRQQLTKAHSRAMAFSLDGTRLAVLSSRESAHLDLAIWDIASGRLLLHRPYQSGLARGRRGGHRDRLTWSADGQALLHNETVLLEGETGTPVWGLNERNVTTLLGLARGRRLVLDRQSSYHLAVRPFPKGAVDACLAARKSRTERIPERTQHAVDSAVNVALAEATSPWQPPALHQAGVILGDLVLSEIPLAKVPCVRVLPQLGRLVVQRTRVDPTQHFSNSNLIGPIPSEVQTIVETYDHSSSKLLNTIELPGRSDLLDVSNDGSKYLTGMRLAAKRDWYSRLDVWNSGDGAHLVGWRPVSKTTPPDKAVSLASFVDGDSVLVQHGDYVTSWQLPECRLNYSLNKRAQMAVDPARKYFLVGDMVSSSEDGRYYPVREVQSGGIAQKLILPERHYGTTPIAMTFSVSGQQVVGLLKPTTWGYQWLVVWDIESGQIVKDLALPAADLGQLFALDEGHVLGVASPLRSKRYHYLVDLEQERVPLAFVGDLKEALFETYQDRLWRDEGRRLVARSLMASARNQGGGWRISPEIAPGMPVTFEFKPSLNGYGEFRGQAQEIVENLGWKTGGGATRVEFNVTESTKTGVWDNENNRRLDRRVRRYQVRVVAPDGAELWEQHSDVTMEGTLVVGSGREGKIKAIDDDSEFFETWLQRLKIPPVLFRKDWAAQIPEVPLP